MEKKDLLCVGMALVDSIIKGFDPTPVSASGFRAESGSLNAGGEAVNEAVAAAKLGLNTGILCSLGNDGAGDLVNAVLEKNRVDTSFVVRSDARPTPVTTMFVNEDGTRKSITNRSHRFDFPLEEYREILQSAKAVSFASLFRAPFDDPARIEKVVRIIHDAGGLIFADTKLPNFRKNTLDDLKESLPDVDYIFPNEDEARYYSGKEDPREMAEVFLSYGVKNVIVKLGGKGCFFKNATEEILLPACEIVPIDATGAGDNFIAGFIAAKLQGCGGKPYEKAPATDEEALRFANGCGAACTTAVGAHAGLKNREQVLNLAAGLNPKRNT